MGKLPFFQLLLLNRFCTGTFLDYSSLKNVRCFSTLICQNYMSEKDNNSNQKKLEFFLRSRVLGMTFTYAMEIGFTTFFFSIQSLFLYCNKQYCLPIWIVDRTDHVVPIPLFPRTILSQVELAPGILLYQLRKIK